MIAKTKPKSKTKPATPIQAIAGDAATPAATSPTASDAFWNGPQLVCRRKDLFTILPFQKTKIDALLADPTFPKPALLTDGDRARVWFKRDILRFIESRFAAASDGVTKKPRAVSR